MVLTQRVMERAEAAFRREREALEAERQRLVDWHHHMARVTQEQSSRTAKDRAEIQAERESLEVEAIQLYDREVAVAFREESAARMEKEVA